APGCGFMLIFVLAAECPWAKIGKTHKRAGFGRPSLRLMPTVPNVPSFFPEAGTGTDVAPLSWSKLPRSPEQSEVHTMATVHQTTVVGVFDTRAQAEVAVDNLWHAGFPPEDVGIAGPGEQPHVAETCSGATENVAARGAVTGAIAGGTVGAVAGALIAGL